MLQWIIRIIVCCWSVQAVAQVTFTIDDFSPHYYGKVLITDTSAVFSEGWTAIYDKKTHKELIRVTAEELLYLPVKNGEGLRSNILELPYGEQSQIMYEDYNFDGIRDFAIMDGQNSCYHGPSFLIYLGTTTGGFQYSEAFSRLSQEYCGMFYTDPSEKTLKTMTKSGCCWHQYSVFKIKNNRPYPISIIEEGLSTDGMAWNYVVSELKNGRMHTKEYSRLQPDIPPENIILSFGFNNGKQLQLFIYEDALHYLFTNIDEEIELLYSETFVFNPQENSLTFQYKQTTYKVTDNSITAITPQKVYPMKGASSTLTGGLSKLKTLQIPNVTVQ